MTNNRITALFIAIGIIAALVFNPSRKAHQLKLKDRFSEINPKSAIFLGKAYRNTLAYRSYYIFSFLTDGKVPITIGALGIIWVNDERIDIP
jgi:hypothetical protein